MVEDEASSPLKDAVDSRDIELVLAFYKYLRAPLGSRTSAAEVLTGLVQRRQEVDAMWLHAMDSLTLVYQAQLELGIAPQRTPADVSACERRVVDLAEKACGAFDAYSLKYTHGLIEQCKVHQVSAITRAVTAACHST